MYPEACIKIEVRQIKLARSNTNNYPLPTNGEPDIFIYCIIIHNYNKSLCNYFEFSSIYFVSFNFPLNKQLIH